MRALRKNTQRLYYALQNGRTEIPVLDSDGHAKTLVVDGETITVGSGSYTNAYSTPVVFYANISQSSGEVQSAEFGVDIAAYDAIIVCDKGYIPLKETSLIWYQTTPSYLDADNTILDAKSADYRVLAIKTTLNGFKAVLGRITK